MTRRPFLRRALACLCLPFAGKAKASPSLTKDQAIRDLIGKANSLPVEFLGRHRPPGTIVFTGIDPSNGWPGAFMHPTRFLQFPRADFSPITEPDE